MTAREMQIEFERRITLMNSDFELNEKITSDTIFSFLNAYTERFVRMNYLQEDQVQDGTRALKKNADSLKGLIVRATLSAATKDNKNTDKTTERFILPNDYFLYIRSNSSITSSYKDIIASGSVTQTSVTPNKTIREDDVEKIISTYYNKIILRNPYVVINSGNVSDSTKNVYINVIHDDYTTVTTLDLVYYRKPKKFNVINVDNVNILDRCELPENVHMEIVEGAVEMFITEAKYRLSNKQNNPQRQ